MLDRGKLPSYERLAAQAKTSLGNTLRQLPSAVFA